MIPLHSVGVLYTEADAIEAFGKIWISLISKLKGKPWKLSSRIIQELRESRMPQLLASL